MGLVSRVQDECPILGEAGTALRPISSIKLERQAILGQANQAAFDHKSR
jgi:hypothetical protein